MGRGGKYPKEGLRIAKNQWESLQGQEHFSSSLEGRPSGHQTSLWGQRGLECLNGGEGWWKYPKEEPPGPGAAYLGMSTTFWGLQGERAPEAAWKQDRSAGQEQSIWDCLPPFREFGEFLKQPGRKTGWPSDFPAGPERTRIGEKYPKEGLQLAERQFTWEHLPPSGDFKGRGLACSCPACEIPPHTTSCTSRTRRDEPLPSPLHSAHLSPCRRLAHVFVRFPHTPSCTPPIQRAPLCILHASPPSGEVSHTCALLVRLPEEHRHTPPAHLEPPKPDTLTCRWAWRSFSRSIISIGRLPMAFSWRRRKRERQRERERERERERKGEKERER
ncbi:hypothetical protein L345_15376, partial [Ophiophagus hannah]